jgi:gamma-glutamyltranspeptidase/glutathione hydrolase
LRYVLGAPGGARIPAFVADTLVGMVDLGLDPQAAVDRPHVLDRNAGVELEAGTPAEALAPMFAARGYAVRAVELNSGLHVIARQADGTLVGGADPRREGMAAGLDR